VKLKKTFNTLYALGEAIEMNNLIKTVMHTITSPKDIENNYKLKLLIKSNKVKKNKLNDWQVIIVLALIKHTF